MARVFSRDELPRFASLRDGRARLDLVTENVPVAAEAMRADRIVYGPGDTSAVHYHVGCVHVFYVLRGEGVADVESESMTLAAGDVLTIEAGEVHWFENPGAGEFAFVEFWAPPPADTVWTQQGDACTWRPLAAAEVKA
jgi:mannose-6-phosphate isomerase-like protein (cupin superfamily)